MEISGLWHQSYLNKVSLGNKSFSSYIRFHSLWISLNKIKNVWHSLVGLVYTYYQHDRFLTVAHLQTAQWNCIESIFKWHKKKKKSDIDSKCKRTCTLYHNTLETSLRWYHFFKKWWPFKGCSAVQMNPGCGVSLTLFTHVESVYLSRRYFVHGRRYTVMWLDQNVPEW